MRLARGDLVRGGALALAWLFGCGDPMFKAQPANAGVGGTPVDVPSEPAAGSAGRGDGGSAAGGSAPAAGRYTGNNAADFVSSAPATPLNAASPLTP